MRTNKLKPNNKTSFYQIIIAGAFVLLMHSSAHALLILDVNIGGGASEYTNVVFDGEDTYVDMSGIGGWSLVVASAGAEPDYSGGHPEIHLSLIANCLDGAGCDTLEILAASDYPVEADRIGLFFGNVPGNNVDASAHLFTGTYSGDNANPVITKTSITGPWVNSINTTLPMVGSDTDTLWGLSAVLISPNPSLSSLDIRVAVPEPGTIALLISGLLILQGLARRNRRLKLKNIDRD